MTAVASIERELRSAVAAEVVTPSAAYLTDQTEARGLRGNAAAVALPRTAEEVAEVVTWCYANGVAVVPRGGGTGYAGGAVPIDGGVVLALERLNRVRSFDPLVWRIEVEAGLSTAELRRVAREGGLLFAPDPGAAEQSQIGGNIATNAGGPHAFKYGVTGAWVTGLEVVVPPGDLVRPRAVAKDVAGYDLKHLLIGSEGTLGVITAAWLRLTPAPEAAWPVIGFFDGVQGGVAAIERVVGSGLPAAALEYVDSETMRYAGATSPARCQGVRSQCSRRPTVRSTKRHASAATCSRSSERTRSCSTRPRPRARSRPCGAGGTGSRSSSTHSAAARQVRTSQCLSTGSARRSRSRSRLVGD